jgi:hypothetical protein
MSALAEKQEERSFSSLSFSFSFLSLFPPFRSSPKRLLDIPREILEDLAFPFSLFIIIIYTYLFLIGVISIGSLFQRGTNVS